MIELLEVSRQFNNREMGFVYLPLHIERARSKILAFFIALKQSYVKITIVLSARCGVTNPLTPLKPQCPESEAIRSGYIFSLVLE